MAGGALASLVIKLGLDASGVSKGVAQANAATKGLNTSTSRMGAGMQRGFTGASKAATHFRGVVGGVGKAMLGLGAIGVGLGAVSFFKDSISSATEFGNTVERLHQLTGIEIGDISQLSDALDYYGLSAEQQTKTIGMLEKNVGNLTKTTATATKFQEDYGLSLLDSTGHVKDAATLLADTADFWNNTGIPQQTKVVALTKLYGRSWQDLIPILSTGKKGVQDAVSAGIRLTPEAIAANERLRDSQRAFNDSLGDLKVMVGNIFIPALADMTQGVADFVNNHQADIVGYFKQALAMAKDFASFVAKDVVPTVMGLAKSAIGFWNSIPGPLKDLLIKGFVADRTVKFLFGFSLADLGKDLIGGALKGIGGSFFQRGATPANPLFVADIAGGGIGGAAGGATGFLKSIAGSLLTGGAVLLALGAVAAAIKVGFDFLKGVEEQTAAVNTQMTTFLKGNPTAAQMDESIAALQAMPGKLGLIDKALFDANAGGVKDTWQKQGLLLMAIKDVLVVQPQRTGAEFAAVIADLEAHGIPVTSQSIITALGALDVSTAQHITDAAAASDQVAAHYGEINAAATAFAAEVTGNHLNKLGHLVDASGNRVRHAVNRGSLKIDHAASRAARYAQREQWALNHGFVRVAVLTARVATNTGLALGLLGGISRDRASQDAHTGRHRDPGTWHDTGGGIGGGRAGGGHVAPWMSYPANERGGEWLHMGSESGRVYPTDPGRAGGGGDMHFHIGTLIANDSGLDELQRRIEKRLRLKRRDRRLVGAAV